MLCLEVSLNDRKYCLAGLGEKGAISTFVTCVRFGPDGAEPDLPVPPGSILLTVSGITEDLKSVHWGDVLCHLKLGDEVGIKVVEAENPDPFTVTPVLPPDEGNTPSG